MTCRNKPEVTDMKVVIKDTDRKLLRLTTVQQSGQNHHRNNSANKRKRTRSVMSRMVPSNWRQEESSRYP